MAEHQPTKPMTAFFSQIRIHAHRGEIETVTQAVKGWNINPIGRQALEQTKQGEKNMEAIALSAINEMGVGMALLPLLWVFGLMAVIVVSYVGKRTNENNRQRIGAEIEAIKDAKTRANDNHTFALWLTKYGLESMTAGYSSASEEHRTKVIHDGSLNSGGVEFISPPIYDGQHGKWMHTISNLLKGIVGIDRSTGFHIHVGMKDSGSGWEEDGQPSRSEAYRIGGRCAYGYGWFQPVFDTIVSASRRGRQQYLCSMEHMTEHNSVSAKSIVVREYDYDTEEYKYETFTNTGRVSDKLYSIAMEHPKERYQNVNLFALRKHGTVEYRQHQGTVNGAKMTAWADLMYLFTCRCADEESFSTIEAYPQTMNGMMAWLGLAKDDPLRMFYNKRAWVLSGMKTQGLHQACPTCHKLDCEQYSQCGKTADEDAITAHFGGRNQDYSEYECNECGHQGHMDEDYGVEEYGSSGNVMAHCGNCGEECVHSNPYGMSAHALGILFAFMSGLTPLFMAVALAIGCGIGAIHAGATKKATRKRLTQLWIGLESRGGQAAGVGWVNKSDPKSLWYLKRPVAASSLAHHLKKELKRDTIYAMLHTRYATHGLNNTDNAHPHFGPNEQVMMVHNGVVHNSDKVWRVLDETFNANNKKHSLKTGPVDSQAVAACLELGGIEEVVKHCEGSMSLIWTDRRDPQGTLKCWTNGGNPLVMGRLDNETTGAIVIGSTDKITEKAMGKRLKTIWDCKVGREYTIAPDGTMSKRDIEGSEDTAGFYYSWRDYKQSAPKKYTNYTNYTAKTYSGVDGDRDNCALPVGTQTDILRDDLSDSDVTTHDLNECYQKMDSDGSWPPFNGWHGYDAINHEGETPQGEFYQLSHSVHAVTDMNRIMAGQYYENDLLTTYADFGSAYNQHWAQDDLNWD